MSFATVEVIRIKGICNAKLRVGDRFHLKSVELIPQDHNRVCQYAFATIVSNVGRLRFGENPIFVSCLDPGTGEGGNVIFKLLLTENHGDDKG